MVPSLRREGRLTDAAEAGYDEVWFATALEELRNARPLRDPRLLASLKAMEAGRGAEAKRTLSKYLVKHPRDPDALNLMAEVAHRAGRLQEAEACLARCVHWMPDHEVYRYNYVHVLLKMNKLEGALIETEILLKNNPRNPLYRNLKGSLLKKMERYPEAVAWYRLLAEDYPESSLIQCELGGALRSLGGHREECTAAFLRASELTPGLGRVWWNLASLKTFRFSESQIAEMETQLRGSALSAESRAELHYALGKAYDDVRNYEKAFGHYSRGNALRRVALDYDPDSTSRMVSWAERVFTPELFRLRAEAGCKSREPIFVLGMQRAGSTLVEQILGSHSAMEGAGELNFILRLVAEDVMPKSGPDYPNGMDRIEPSDLKAIGEKYLEYAATKRNLGRPYFVDKCPFNLWHVGLIHLILPNAKIIDARRHPLACCFANFTMSFAFGPPLSYKQTEIGRFYADYVRLMAHFDRVMPGKIHRVIYERLVADLEGEVRRMLDYLELPFEQSCLEYYKNERAFNSLSNEQVRSPIFSEGVDRWRNFEPWLGPMKAALGPVLDAYPDVPEFVS